MKDYLSVTHKKEDAEKKWCPFSCTPDCGPGTHIKKIKPGRHCLTTGCMAWIDETDHMYEIALGRCGLVTHSRA